MSYLLSLGLEPLEVVVTVDWNLFFPKAPAIICIQQDSNLYDDHQVNKILGQNANSHNLNKKLLLPPTRSQEFWDRTVTFQRLAWDLEGLQQRLS
jgi:hypothetical protein